MGVVISTLSSTDSGSFPPIYIFHPFLLSTVVLNQWQFCTLGDIWQYLETFLAVIMAAGGGVGIFGVGDRDAAKHLTMHRTDPPPLSPTLNTHPQRIIQSKMSIVLH